MKYVRIIGLILGTGVFFLLNSMSQRFFNPKAYTLPYDFSQMVFGISSEELQAQATTKVVVINNDGDIKYFLTKAPTPIDALLDNGYVVNTMNKVITTSPIAELSNHAYIILQTYRTTIEEINISVPYSKIQEGTSLCPALAEAVVTQKGVMGIMTQTVKKTYEGENLVATEITDQKIIKPAINQIVILKGPNNSPSEVPQIGYNCTFWQSYVDNSVDTTDEIKQWLKFTMFWESGCNAESNKSYYKGLLQYDPCIWYELYPNENIFDGKLQIKHAIEKLQAGASPANMWPAVYKKYVAQYGPLSWLAN